MLAFTRLTSFLLLVLSLSFLTCALPTAATVDTEELAARTVAGQVVLNEVVHLKTKIDVATEVLVACVTIAEVKAQVNVIVALIEVASKAILATGASIVVDAALKAQIAAEVAAIINAIVQASLEVSAKFGLALAAAIWAKLDASLHLLLTNLSISIGGIIVLVAKLITAATFKAIVDLNLALLAHILTPHIGP